MSRARPLAPCQQKKFLSLDEIGFVETLLVNLAEVIHSEFPNFRRDPAASPKALASLVLQLQLVMDDLLGEKSAPSERFHVKIPAAFFRDFAHPQGVLKHMLVWALEFRHHQQQQIEPSLGSRRFELVSEKNRSFSIQLIQELWKRLKENGLWIAPKVFFQKGFSDDEKEKLACLVNRLSGVVVENVEDASHIVVSQSVMDPEDKECYYRILDQRGSKAFVHWWYRPDSYDTWMVFGGGGYQTGNASSEKAKIMPSLFLPKSGVWTLSVEWLYLSEKYNEWMNEGDFELSQMESTSSEDNENDSVLLGSPTLRKQAAGAAGAPLSSQARFKRPSRRISNPSEEAEFSRCSPADSVEPNGRRKRYRSSVKIPFSTRQACSLGLDQTDAAPEGGVAPASRERYGKEGAAASAVPDDAPGRPKGESQNLVVTLTFSGKAKENSIAPQYQGFTECYVTNISPELQRLVNKVSSEDLTEDALSPIDPEDIAKARQLLSQNVCKESSEKAPLAVPPLAAPDVVTEPSSLAGDAEDGQSSRLSTVGDSASFFAKPQTLSGVTPGPEGTEAVAPGVVRHSARSLMHSVSGTHPRELFHRLRSINPLDSNLDTRLLASSLQHQTPTEQDAITKRMLNAERGLRTMVALWASSCDQPFIFGLDDTTRSEPPDVPPCFLSTSHDSNVSEKPSTLAENDVSLRCVSDAERGALAARHSAELSERIDMFDETGLTASDAKKLPIVIPASTRRWFSSNAVHALEKEQLETWFFGGFGRPSDDSRKSVSGKHAAEVDSHVLATSDEDNEKSAFFEQYRLVRNAIIDRYRVNPYRYLTLTHCRECVDGDVALLTRIHSFLDFWGLINFQALPHTRPSRSRRPVDYSLPSERLERCSEDAKNDVSRTHAVPSDGRPLALAAKCVVCQRLCLHSYYTLKPGHLTGVSSRLLHRAAWCSDCFSNGRYPEVLTQRQFVKTTIPLSGNLDDSTAEARPWSDEELEKLIEGIELHAENWEAVAHHVGTRSAFECVSHFIRLPLEDPLMPHSDDGLHTVFNEAPNPLMTQLKFLTTVLGHDVGAAAAKAAYEALLYGAHNKTRDNIKASETTVADNSASENAVAGCVSAPEHHSISNGSVKVEGDTLRERLDAPVSATDQKIATRHALETAAAVALERGKAEEENIRELLRCLIELKEQQLEDKVRVFYQHEEAIEHALNVMKKKLDESIRTREELRAAAAVANEQHERALTEYQRERQEKQQALQTKLMQQHMSQIQQHQLQQLHFQQQQQHNGVFHSGPSLPSVSPLLVSNRSQTPP